MKHNKVDERLQRLAELRRFLEKQKCLGVEHEILDALEKISLGVAPDEALGLRTPNGGRPLRSAILADRKMRAFQALIKALQDEGKTRTQALDEIYSVTDEGQKGPFGWTRETAESKASDGKHLRHNPFTWKV